MGVTIKNSHSQELVLNPAVIEGWRADRGKLVAEREKIDAGIADLDARINAAALLMGWPIEEGRPSNPEDEFEPVDVEAENMPAAIVRVLTTATRPLTRAEIKGYLRKDQQLAARLDRTPNAFYNGMKRLLKRTAITQAGERFTVPKKHGSPGVVAPELSQ